ncbi:MAG: S8 family serine peptidase, partial [Chloroflexi bacterium]|nr:S8 family serine peptidase [Chloroflexota bacterium]
GVTDGSDPLSLTCDAAVARGAVVCAAAGNDGPRGGSIGSPGAARNVITVGASTDSDQLADFSSRGPTADGRVKPDLLMPGYGIISCRARGTNMGHVIDEFYTEASGTSMATPHASGTVALLLEAKPDLNPAQVKNVLIRSCVNLGLPPNSQGAGRVDAYRALTLAPQPAPLPNPPQLPEAPLGPGCFPLPLWWPLRQTA